MPKLYFVHPQTKGRVVMTVPTGKVAQITKVLIRQGYQQVSRDEYIRWGKRYPTTRLDKEVRHA